MLFFCVLGRLLDFWEGNALALQCLVNIVEKRQDISIFLELDPPFLYETEDFLVDLQEDTKIVNANKLLLWADSSS